VRGKARHENTENVLCGDCASPCFSAKLFFVQFGERFFCIGGQGSIGFFGDGTR
jgi:hypothetical protein